MKPLTQDLSIFKKFNFERPPVGVKFLLNKPEGIEQLETEMPFCEMAKEAQQRSTPFYITKENESCFGKLAMGMEAAPAFAEAGLIGEALEIFQDPRANTRVYQHIATLPEGTVNYVVFSALDALSFDPDLLMIVCSVSQAEILLRAMSYSTGELWDPKGTPVLGCSWLYIHPYQSGKVNYTITGLAFGMKAKQIYPEGLMILSIPYNWIPVITANLQEMKWVPFGYADGREKFEEKERIILDNLASQSAG
jgi:uncharacterized protein (DUF169 family)